MDTAAIQHPVSGNCKTAKTPQVGGSCLPKSGKVDVIALAYYYLVDAATTRSESALVQAKQLKANGYQQQQLNNEEANLKWNYVPKEHVKHHSKVISHHHWTWRVWKHKWEAEWTTWENVTWSTVKNQLTVTNDQAKNEEMEAHRQELSQKMSVLQQTAKISETDINSVNQEASQTMSEGSLMIQIVQSLTFKALLRQQPQG